MKPAFCQSYEEARELFQKGELQAWDGTRWEDIPKDATPFFSRRVEEYRRRPKDPRSPKFFVWDPSMRTGHRIYMFETAREVAVWMWGKNVEGLHVFKRADSLPLDIAKVEKILEEM